MFQVKFTPDNIMFKRLSGLHKLNNLEDLVNC